MSKLVVDQQSIKELFSNKKVDFLIPDYQRPYAWGDDECETLWDDIFEFAFPNNDYSAFDTDDEYFLGPIVTFKNDDGKLEIIDGQQRLTTLMLLLRAFYSHFGSMQDPNSISTREDIAKCIWKTDEFGHPNTDKLKIDSEVSTDETKDEFLSILKTGKTSNGQKSKYAKNYRFFEGKISDFLNHFPTYFAYLPNRIMNNCILLPIEAESQDTALRIFSTLNDRGKPLADTDIFKAQFYKYYSDLGKKEDFILRWKNLESLCDEIFPSVNGSPMDELFTRYMYYERARMGIRLTTTEALRKFYERNKYEILKREQTLNDLEILAEFWKEVSDQDDAIFSDRILRRLFVLYYAPNSMWTYLVSVYFMANKTDDNTLEEEAFYEFLNRITAFIFAYALVHPGVNALRTPTYPEMINIVNGKRVEFQNYKLDRSAIKNALDNFAFTNGRPITKSMLAWWAFENNSQTLIDVNMRMEIEHIYPRKRQENEYGLSDPSNLETLGNKALLEKNINIRASDYRFRDKKKYYTGFITDSGKKKEGTANAELRGLTVRNDFTEDDIVERTHRINKSFLHYLKENDVLDEE